MDVTPTPNGGDNTDITNVTYSLIITYNQVNTNDTTHTNDGC